MIIDGNVQRLCPFFCMKCMQAGEEWRPCTYVPSNLGSRSTVVVRQAGRQANEMLAVYKSFKIRQLQF